MDVQRERCGTERRRHKDVDRRRHAYDRGGVVHARGSLPVLRIERSRQDDVVALHADPVDDRELPGEHRSATVRRDGRQAHDDQLPVPEEHSRRGDHVVHRAEQERQDADAAADRKAHQHRRKRYK